MDKAAAAEFYTAPALEALKAFPVTPGEIALASVSENVTFRVTDGADGAAYVLRLHRPGYHTFEELNSERVWTRALAQAGLDVPIGVPTRTGADYVKVFVPATGEHRHVGMLRWIEGEVLNEAMRRQTDPEARARYLERLGAILADLHLQSSAWRPPEGFVRHHLDVDGLMGEAPFWGPFWEHPILTAAERDALLSAREKVRGALARYGEGRSTYGVIHADLHIGNVLVNGEQLTPIDFDDMAFGWHLYDFAVALFAYHDHPSLDDFRSALLRGYRTRREPPPRAEALIPMFLMIRAMAVIGWFGQRPEHDSPETQAHLLAIKDFAVAKCQRFEPPC